MTKAREFAIEESREIRKLIPHMRVSLQQEMAAMVSSIYQTMYEAKHWSARVLAERTHGRIPSPDQIQDIIEDINVMQTWRALSIRQEKFCKDQIVALRGRKLQ